MQTQEVTNAMDDLDLENALAGLLADEQEEIVEAAPEPEPVIDVIEEVEPAPIEVANVQPVASSVLGADELTELELALDIAESYEEQETTAIATTEAATPNAAAAAAANKTPRPTRASRKAKNPATPKDLSAVPDEFFVLSGSLVGITTLDPTQLAAAKTSTLAGKPEQVKVQEKFDNALLSLAQGKLPCSYTMVAFKVLEAKKSVTVADLVSAYKATPKGGKSTDMLGEGTARAQAGQMGALLPALGLAERTGKTLTLKADSVIAERIRALMV